MSIGNLNIRASSRSESTAVTLAAGGGEFHMLPSSWFDLLERIHSERVVEGAWKWTVLDYEDKCSVK